MRSLTLALLALLAAAPAAGQQLVQTPTIVRCPSPTRDAGTYHVATDTWTRSNSPGANLGPDVIYRADIPSGYFGVGWEGAEGVDEGVLPGPGHPMGGPSDAYRIDGFRFSYCSNSSAAINWQHRFYDSYVPCDQPDNPANCIHQASTTFVVAGLPSASACWSVTVDLTGGAEFCMQADGGPCSPGYQVGWGENHFGWGSVWSTVDGAYAGPLLSGGRPDWMVPGEGTCYLPSMTCSQGATALGVEDLFGIGAPLSGCFWFQGFWNQPCHKPEQSPWGQFDLTLYTDCGVTCERSDCEGERWCSPAVLNSTGLPGRITLDTCHVGQGSIGADQLPLGEFAYLLVGNGNAIISQPPGSIGDLCLGGSLPAIGRYVLDAQPVNVLGRVETDLIHGVTGGGSGRLPDPPGGELAAGQSWNFQYWYRDGGSSNFTDAIRITWLP